jgi:hypothetical protein
LSNIEKIADALDVEPWRLLIPPKQSGYRETQPACTKKVGMLL